MRTPYVIIAALLAAPLAGCDTADAPEPAPEAQQAAASAALPAPDGAVDHRFASWKGRWTGVEGMYVVITPTASGTYDLEMQSDLDTKGTYVGKDSEHGIKFSRGDEQLSLYRTAGSETGLKYLADKRDCLMVKSGEGYCRD